MPNIKKGEEFAAGLLGSLNQNLENKVANNQLSAGQRMNLLDMESQGKIRKGQFANNPKGAIQFIAQMMAGGRDPLSQYEAVPMDEQKAMEDRHRKDYWVLHGYNDALRGYVSQNAADNSFVVTPMERLMSKTMTNPTEGQLKEASALDRISLSVKQIDDYYDPRFTGAVQNPLQKIQQRYGVEPTKDKAKFNQAVGNLRLALAEERGKNLTEMEFKLLMEAIPDEAKSDQDFEAKMEQFKDTMNFVRNQKIKRGKGLLAGAEQIYAQPTLPASKSSKLGDMAPQGGLQVGGSSGLTPEQRRARIAELRAKLGK